MQHQNFMYDKHNLASISLQLISCTDLSDKVQLCLMDGREKSKVSERLSFYHRLEFGLAHW